MPEMHGPQLAKRITRAREEAKVLYMSGYASDTIGHDGLLDPETTLLQKPFSPKELAYKLREVLEPG